MTEPRRVRPVLNVGGFAFVTDGGPYDEVWQLQVLRERMGLFGDEPYGFAAQCAGGALADFVRNDLEPLGLDPVLAGRVLLAINANAVALVAAGWPAVAYSNALAHAASDLIGDQLPPTPPDTEGTDR